MDGPGLGPLSLPILWPALLFGDNSVLSLFHDKLTRIRVKHICAHEGVGQSDPHRPLVLANRTNLRGIRWLAALEFLYPVSFSICNVDGPLGIEVD